jgi:hypothetical protein
MLISLLASLVKDRSTSTRSHHRTVPVRRDAIRNVDGDVVYVNDVGRERVNQRTFTHRLILFMRQFAISVLRLASLPSTYYIDACCYNLVVV